MVNKTSTYDKLETVSFRESLRQKLFQLIAYSDTTPTRFFLAFTATMWCLTLMLPGETLDRPVYYVMSVIFGTNHAEEKWALMWGVLAVGLWWRTFSSAPAPRFALLINYLSVFLFSISTYSVLAARMFPFPSMIVPGFACIVASIWVLVRTHINSERGWRID